ncbi:MAG: histidine phosphatase family protein [Thermodesulfovibrionales bacterium]
MVTVLYLIRHGETEGAEKRRYKGSIDVPLSENGIKQMELLSAYIVKEIKNNTTFNSSKQKSHPPASLVIPPNPPLEKGGWGDLKEGGKGEGEHVAIVAHGGVNRIILCLILGIPLENIFRIEQDYGALNIIEFWEKYPVVKLINGIVYI